MKIEEELEILKEKNKNLYAANRRMSAELMQIKDNTSGQSHFLDSLENLLLDFGFKVVSINE